MLFVFFVAAAFGTYFYYNWNEMNLDLDTCQPSGLAGRARHVWNKADFWVWQSVLLDRLVEDYKEGLPGGLQLCRVEFSDDQEEYQKCIKRRKGRLQKLTKCQRYCNKMVKLYVP